MNIFRRCYESFKAWRRGDKRIAPEGVSGRVYERDNVAGRHSTLARAKVSLRKTVIRKGADNG